MELCTKAPETRKNSEESLRGHTQCYRNSSNRPRLHCRCVIFTSDAQDTTEATVTAARQGVATVAIADRCADLGLHPKLT